MRSEISARFATARTDSLLADVVSRRSTAASRISLCVRSARQFAMFKRNVYVVPFHEDYPHAEGLAQPAEFEESLRRPPQPREPPIQAICRPVNLT